MLLIIDNYDSFTYNLVQYFQVLREEVMVVRNDMIELEEIERMNLSAIVISPGPGRPENAGISAKIVERYKGKIPILGICLGHQVIGMVSGGKIVEGQEPVHGKVHEIIHDGRGVFKGLKNPLKVTRYHSLVVSEKDFPDDLEITARTLDGEIMGIKSKKYLLEGIQFHPEAILTEMGMELLENFLIEAEGRY